MATKPTEQSTPLVNERVVISEYIGSAVVELRRLGLHVAAIGQEDLSVRMYTYAEVLQHMLPAVESLETKGRAML